MIRRNWTKDQIENEIQFIKDCLYKRLEQKGYGTFSSSHEILGIIAEEYQELIDAIKLNRSATDKMNELADIAVACILGMASIENKMIDW